MLPSWASSASVGPPSPVLSARSRASALSAVTSQLRICPPSRATSMRTNAFSATGHHLREDAVNGVGMHERHLEPVQAAPWTLVDQSSACHRELAKDRFDVVR